jgi:hypothetical protein
MIRPGMPAAFRMMRMMKDESLGMLSALALNSRT